MILRDNRNKPQTPLDKLKAEIELCDKAEAENKVSLENFVEQVAELICENAVCIVDNKGKVITVKQLNGQVFKLVAENLK